MGVSVTLNNAPVMREKEKILDNNKRMYMCMCVGTEGYSAACVGNAYCLCVCVCICVCVCVVFVCDLLFKPSYMLPLFSFVFHCTSDRQYSTLAQDLPASF